MKYFLLVILAGILSGCLAFPQSYGERGVVRVEIQKSEQVRITSASVFDEGGRTVVRGEARFPVTSINRFFSGHIDVTMRLPNGRVIKHSEVGLTMKRIPKRRGRQARFVSKFPPKPPIGTVVQISYHTGVHEKPLS